MNTSQLISTLEMVKRMVTASGIANNDMCNINELLEMVITDLKSDETAQNGASVAFNAPIIQARLASIQFGLDRIDSSYSGQTKSQAVKAFAELTEYIWMCYHRR